VQHTLSSVYAYIFYSKDRNIPDRHHLFSSDDEPIGAFSNDRGHFVINSYTMSSRSYTGHDWLTTVSLEEIRMQFDVCEFHAIPLGSRERQAKKGEVEQ